MGRVISDLPLLTETVANGDLLVCHNVSKAAGARDEKLTVEKLLTDALGNRGVTITSGGNVGIGTGTPIALLDIRSNIIANNIITIGTISQGLNPNDEYGAVQFFNSDGSGAGAGVRAKIGALASGNQGGQGGQLAFSTQTGASGSSLTEQMRITSTGDVGIGTATPGAKLDVVGDVLASSLTGTGNRAVYSTSTGVLTNSSSDARMKTDVEPIGAGDALGLVNALRPVRYRWGEKYAATRGEQVEMGLIAQEVRAHVPEVIGENEDGMLSVDYPKLTALLIGAVQALTARVAALEAAAA
jgi:hypothetical protein